MSSITHSTHAQRRVSYSRLIFVSANLAVWAALIAAAIVLF
jgi:hypothetical protein